jgi:hypothetical protein
MMHIHALFTYVAYREHILRREHVVLMARRVGMFTLAR